MLGRVAAQALHGLVALPCLPLQVREAPFHRLRRRLFRQAPPTAVQRIFRLQILRLPRFKARVSCVRCKCSQCRVTVWGPQVLVSDSASLELEGPKLQALRGWPSAKVSCALPLPLQSMRGAEAPSSMPVPCPGLGPQVLQLEGAKLCVGPNVQVSEASAGNPSSSCVG